MEGCAPVGQLIMTEGKEFFEVVKLAEEERDPLVERVILNG